MRLPNFLEISERKKSLLVPGDSSAGCNRVPGVSNFSAKVFEGDLSCDGICMKLKF